MGSGSKEREEENTEQTEITKQTGTEALAWQCPSGLFRYFRLFRILS